MSTRHLVAGLVVLSSFSTHALADEQKSIDAIINSLASETRLEFFEAPLSEVVDYLRDMHSINLHIDMAGLKEGGLDADLPLTQQLKGISLRSALNLMLREVQLGYAIENEVLLITTAKKAAEIQRTVFYSTSQIPTNEGKIEIVDLLQTLTTKPQKKDATPAPHILKVGDKLVVKANEQQHYEIQSILHKLTPRAEQPNRLSAKPKARPALKRITKKKSASTGDPIAGEPTAFSQPDGADPFGVPKGLKKSTNPFEETDPFGYPKRPKKQKKATATDDPFGS